MNPKNTFLRPFFLAAALLVSAASASAPAPDDDAAQLRRENIQLRMRVAELERALRGRGGSLSSLDGEYRSGGFFSLADRWDEFSEPDDILSSGGLVPLSRIDTILVIPQDDALSRYIDIYTVARGKSMVGILRRFDRYRPQFEKAFAKYGVPKDGQDHVFAPYRSGEFRLAGVNAHKRRYEKA